MMTSGLTSSIADCWETPRGLFQTLDREFGFRLDAAASAHNAKCARYYDIEADGLASDWGDGPVWLNPPYGRQIAPWMDKCADYAESGGGDRMRIDPHALGHGMVSPLRHAGVGDPPFPRTDPFRRFLRRSAFSVGPGGIPSGPSRASDPECDRHLRGGD